MLGPGTDLQDIKKTAETIQVTHNLHSISNRYQVEKMFSKNPTIVVADPSISSSTGLLFIDQIFEPIKPYKKHKMGNTQEAKFARMLKMKNPALTSYYTFLQKPKSLKTMNIQKSTSLFCTLNPESSEEETSVEAAFK